MREEESVINTTLICTCISHTHTHTHTQLEELKRHVCELEEKLTPREEHGGVMSGNGDSNGLDEPDGVFMCVCVGVWVCGCGMCN